MPAERASEEIVRLDDAQPEVEVHRDAQPGPEGHVQGEVGATVHDGFAVRPPHAADPDLRRRLLPWAIVAMVAVVVMLGGIVFTYTPFFGAKTISVRGEGHLSRASVLRIAQLGPSTNVFHMDPRAAERRLERDPWIARATVTRHLPSTLAVVVLERVPVARALTATGAGMDLLAADGTVLGRASGVLSALPRVGTDDGTGTPTAEELREGAHVVAAMPGALRAQVATVVVGEDESVLVVMRTGVTVTYGDGSHPTAKAEALAAVLAYVEGAHEAIVSVDVSAPAAPTADRPGGLAAVVGR